MIDQTRISTSSASRSTSRIPVSPIIRRHRSLSALDLHRRQHVVWSSSSSCSYSHSSSLLLRKNNNNQFKSNPYVGWFRHSPDTTMLKKTLFPRNPATKINTKHFPFTTPQALPNWKKQQQVFLSNVLMRNGGMNLLRRRLADQDLIAKFLEEEPMLPKGCCYKDDKQDYNVRKLTELLNGRLRGGGTTGSSILPLDPYDYRHHHHGKKDNDIHHHHDDDDELNLSSSTVHLLTRFAYWLLLPFQDDEEPEEQDDDENDGNNDTDDRHHHHPQGHVDTTKNMPSSSSSCISDEDDDNDSLDDYDYDPSANNHNLLSPPTSAVDIGISSQAEAYYAHYSQHQHHAHNNHHYGQHHPHHLHDQDLSRLDYVITQMDILRMQRNASRHLDVESIYQLPTQTYYSNKKNPDETNNNSTEQQQHQASLSSCTTTTTAQEDCRDGHDESTRNEEEESITMAAEATAVSRPAVEGWSWMLVPTTTTPEDTNTKTGINSTSSLDGQGNNNNNMDQDSCRRQEHDGHVDVDDEDNLCLEPEQQQQHQKEEEEEQHVCVICLEHFVNGDRLRVLPCRHKFHVGCIDKWLSGSSSFQDCHTAGCPTCKKRPHVILSGFNDNEGAAEERDWSSHSDGSLPGWAFAQLGSVMAAASADSIAHQ